MKKLTKNLFHTFIASSIVFSPFTSIKADTIDTITRAFSYAVAEDPTKTISGGGSQINIYKIDSTGAASLVVENLYPDGGPGTFSADQYAIDSAEGKIYFREPPRGSDLPLRARVFDIKTETLADDWITITGMPDGAMPIFVTMPTATKDQINKQCESDDGTTCNANSNEITLGGTGTEELMKVDANGISTGGTSGKSLVKYVGDELHIGQNSWITKEENGRQKVYAKDAAGNPIPIDYTNGTKLLINGRDVEQSINNVGALSAALTGLPTVPTDTTLACGLGSGTHGGNFALSGGCASKVNEKLSINYAASMTIPGQDYAGDFEDTFSARAGFVWKLGKPVNSELISMKEKEFQTKIISLEEKNQELLARLERLEKVALGKVGSKDLASNTIYYHEMNKGLNFKKITK
jgi:hypothetical protein